MDADKVHTLPSLENITSPEKLSNCMLDLNLRKTQRLQYPGACSLVYQHLMQIVIECLFGWSKKTQSGRTGILGKVQAFARADEEQGRKTLHGHWQIWIEDFNKCRDKLFNEDGSKNETELKIFLQYISNVICATYGEEFVIQHKCCPCETIIPVHHLGESGHDSDTNINPCSGNGVNGVTERARGVSDENTSENPGAGVSDVRGVRSVSDENTSVSDDSTGVNDVKGVSDISELVPVCAHKFQKNFHSMMFIPHTIPITSL